MDSSALKKLERPSKEFSVPGCYWKPDKGFLDDLASYLKGKRVLEVFAGNGYLASCLKHRGASIYATTLFSGHDSHEKGLYFPVQEMSAVDAVNLRGQFSDLLLLSWPTTTSEVVKAARAWGCDKDIIFIGEVTDYSKGHLGGCATDAFFYSIKEIQRFGSYKGNPLEAAMVCRLLVP